ncbi:MAG: hypothetical protein DMF49_09475 [Acidobacteria bacterium]|nr:MAG: hypothetical protein DMF49_09475 [Acidobacteriota bacterium]
MHHPGIIRGRSPSGHPLVRVAMALGCLLSAATGASGRELSFGERVAAQERIERIFWAHRSWPGENPAPRPPFEQVLPEAVLRARVEDILRESRALESLWGRAISGEELQNEMNRMARSTRDAGVLRELFDALGKDPARIAECLARPLLVDRVLRELYSSDARWHGRLRETATAERARYRSPADLRRMSGTYSETTFVREDSEHAKRVAAGTASVRVLPKSDWELELGRLAAIFDRSEPLLRHHEAAVADGAGPEGTNDPTGSLQFPLLEPTAVIEEESSLRVVMVLARDATSLKIATVEWPKRDFDSWWQRAGTTFPVRISTPAYPYTLPEISADPCSPDTWASTRFDLPDPRIGHTSVWTGSEMIVWGGGSGSTSNTGGRYDPATDSWRTTSTVGAPSPRSFHTAVWTGTEMIVWGGNLEPDRTGGRYNPVIDTWMPTSTANAPPSRLYHTAVWTGAEMIVWGGDAGNYGSYSTNTGGRYNPLTDAWLLTSTSGVAERSRHTAVWTGAEMIVWGGHDESTGASLDSGQRYDPSADSWSSVATRDAPSMRLDHTAVWTGTEMIVWGGRTTEATGPALNTGARYDPARNRWTPTTLTGTPKARFLHTAVWSGSEMIVWGGETLTASLGTGARYRPGKNDSWLPVSNLGAPRLSHGRLDGFRDDRLGRLDRWGRRPQFGRPLRPRLGLLARHIEHRRPVGSIRPHGCLDRERDDRLGWVRYGGVSPVRWAIRPIEPGLVDNLDGRRADCQGRPHSRLDEPGDDRLGRQ